MRKDSSIMVDRETLTKLQRISQLSGFSIIDIIRQYVNSIFEIVEENNPDKLNILVKRHEKNGKKSELVLTFVGSMWCGSFKIPENLPEVTKWYMEEKLPEADIFKKQNEKLKGESK